VVVSEGKRCFGGFCDGGKGVEVVSVVNCVEVWVLGGVFSGGMVEGRGGLGGCVKDDMGRRCSR